MSEYTDVLRGIITFEVSEAIAGIDQVKASLNTMYSYMQKGLSTARNSQEMINALSDAGMRISSSEGGKSWQIIDNLTGMNVPLGEATERATAMRLRMDEVYDSVMKTNNLLKPARKGFEDIDTFMKKTTKSAGGMNRNMLMLGLSVMFAGMALQRYMSTAFNAIKETYKMATGEQSEFSQETNKLAAAWEFLKFSLMDALMNSGIFTAIVEGIIQLVNWFAKLPEGVRTIIVIGIVFGLILGTLMLIGGQMLTFINGLTTLKTNGGAGAVLKDLIATAAIILVIIALVWYLFQVWGNADLSTFDKIIATIMGVALAAAIVATILGAWPLALILFAVAIVAFVVFFRKEIWGMFESIGLFIWNWLEWQVAQWNLMWTKIGISLQTIIFDALIWIAGKFDDFINGVVDKANKVLPKAFQISWESDATGMMEGLRDKALAESEKTLLAMRTAVAKEYQETEAAANAGAAANDAFFAKMNNLLSGGSSGTTISTAGTTADAIVTGQAEQVDLQKKTNELLEENNELFKQQMEKANAMNFNGMTSGDIMAKLEEFNSQYNGSTGA